MLTRLLLLAPHEQPGFGTTRGERIECRLMRAFVKEFWQRLFLRTAHVHRFAINNLSDVRRLIVHIADQYGLRWTDDDAGRLQTNIDAMRAEVAFLGRMIFGIDEDRVVRTGGHAGLAADAAGVIDHLRPLHAVLTSCMLLDHVPGNRWRQNISLSKEC